VEPRKEPDFSDRLLRLIYPAFRVPFRNQVIPADDLARAMVDVAVRETGKPGGLILENRDLRAMVELLAAPVSYAAIENDKRGEIAQERLMPPALTCV
jgi:hypothetical protein